MQLQNRIIKIKNASKRMSNYKSCIFILTRLFGFEKSDNGEKLTLSDEVEIDTLIILKTLLQDNNSQDKLNDELSSYEMKMTEDNESFWSCNHCTYNNPIELNTCKMCALPRNVCVNQWGISHSHQKLHLCFNHSLQVVNDHDEKRNIQLRCKIRKMIAQKNMTDETLRSIIQNCARKGWVEELRQCVNVPRSPVANFYILIVCCLNDVKYCCEHFWLLFYEYGYTALHCAIKSNNPIIVELLLKEYGANPNANNNVSWTTLMYWAYSKDRNLSILKLLVKYGFDFARLVNQRGDKVGVTVFHMLCDDGNTDHNIACLKHLFFICQKIPNCSINILAQHSCGWCGLHFAIWRKDIDMTKYLLENVYFPNNDKFNKDGIAFINMRIGNGGSLAAFVMANLIMKWDRNEKSHVEMVKLLVSYGMKFNSEDQILLRYVIRSHLANVAAFFLDENFCPIDTLETIVDFMYEANGGLGSVNTEILKSLYNYGLEHGVIWNKSDHTQIIIEAAKYDLATFKTTMLMILEKHGINDLRQCKQCEKFNDITLKTISQSPNTTPNVKSFIQALICDDKTNLLQLDDVIAKSKQVVLTCVNNHVMNNNNENKIINYRENCSVCGDSGDNSQSLSGFQCDECKSFICDDCTVVQKIHTKINDNGNNFGVLYAVADEIFEYKNNKKLFNKIAKQCPNAIHIAVSYDGTKLLGDNREQLSSLLLQGGTDVNYVSNLPHFKRGSLIHDISVLRDKTKLKELENHNFDFDKFISFRNSEGKTPFLCFCECGGINAQHANYFINNILKKYGDSNRYHLNGFEIDYNGNNGLHLMLGNTAADVLDIVSDVQFVLESVFFPKNSKTNRNGTAALTQQNCDGNTPLHVALGNKPAADIAQLFLKYKCNVATIYNKDGYLPIHVACINNSWRALAVLIQQGLYGEHSDDINLETRNKNNDKHTALELSIMRGYGKCAEILCKNKNIYVDDMSFYNAISRSNNSQILKILLNSMLHKHNVCDWKSFDESKSLSMDFLQGLIQFGNQNGENKCVRFLEKLIEHGIKKEDYVYIALSLNYNLSSIKLNEKNVPNVTIQVNADNTNHEDDTKSANSNNTKRANNEKNSDIDLKEDIIEPWIVKHELGKGAFGQVKLGVNKYNNNERVALKFINIINIPTQFVLGEIAVVQQIDHSSVIMLKGFNLNVFDNGKTVLIAFEYAPYGELFDLLRYKKYFSVGLSYYCFKEIVSALVACHGMNIVHRDLKPQNILIGNDFQIKVADFGLSKTLNENKNGNGKQKKYIVGTPGYMAPELFKENDIKQDSDIKEDDKDNNEFDKACDVFSLSIILWQMLNGYKSKPFNNCKKNDYVYKFIINKNYDSFWKSDYHNNNNNIKFLENGYNQFNNNELIQRLFEQMFEFSPMKRIKAKDIELHSWFKDMNTHKDLWQQYGYKGELQHLYFANDRRKREENEMKEIMDSIGSLYSKENTINTLNIGYDSTQPSNESSLEISGYSTMMKQLNNENNNINYNDNNNNHENTESKSQISELLHKMSHNTSNFVKSRRNSMSNK